MPSKELCFTVLGPSGAGKTTLLSCMYKQFERVLSGTFFPSDNGTFAALNAAWRQMLLSATDSSPEFRSSVQGTEDLREYEFTLKGSDRDARIKFFDFPGGWMNPYDESQAENFKRVIELVRKSSAIIVAVNTPYLMEDEGRYRDNAAVYEMEYILRMSFSDDASAKLIAIVPLKCEKYVRTREGVSELENRMREEFASTFGLMKNPAYSGKLSVEVVPVQTAGNVEFSRFDFVDGQVVGEVYRKNRALPFSPKDADKLLERITEHLEESVRPMMPERGEPERASRLDESSRSGFWRFASVALWILLAFGAFVFSHMYYQERALSQRRVQEIETLRAQLKESEAERSRVLANHDKAVKAANESRAEIETLRAQLKASEAERNRTLANHDKTVKAANESRAEIESLKAEIARLKVIEAEYYKLRAAQKLVTRDETITREAFRTMCSKSGEAMRSELERLRIPPNFRFLDGSHPTLLMFAAKYEYTTADAIRTLIRMGADVNAMDDSHATALVYAVLYNGRNIPVIMALLENGALVSINGVSAMNFTTDFAILSLLRRYQ